MSDPFDEYGEIKDDYLTGNMRDIPNAPEKVVHPTAKMHGSSQPQHRSRHSVSPLLIGILGSMIGGGIIVAVIIIMLVVVQKPARDDVDTVFQTSQSQLAQDMEQEPSPSVDTSRMVQETHTAEAQQATKTAYAQEKQSLDATIQSMRQTTDANERNTLQQTADALKVTIEAQNQIATEQMLFQMQIQTEEAQRATDGARFMHATAEAQRATNVDLPMQSNADVQPTSPPNIQPINLTLYFADAQRRLLVPVTRRTMVPDLRVATTAMQELIAGPRVGLYRLVSPDVQIRDVSRSGDTVTVNLNTHPGDDLALYSIALALSEFPGVNYVQIQVNETNVGPGGHTGPVRRPILNMDNPQGLPTEYTSGTRFLPLYFLYEGRYVQITRLVPYTLSIARETVTQLLAGPGQTYGDILTSPIPVGTRLLDINKEGDSIIVHLSGEFANASDPDAALNALVLSLTELRDEAGERYFQQVIVQVEGKSLAEYWGGNYGTHYSRPALNPE